MANQTGAPRADEFQSGEAAGLRFRARLAPGTAPLLVFLHGVGERGDDNAAQLTYPFFGDPAAIFGDATRGQCHVLAPQAPADDKWVDVPRWDVADWTMRPTPTKSMTALLALIETFVAQHGVERRRIYLSGLSMGAFGVYEVLARRPDLAAAAVAVCGAGDLGQVPRFRHVPLWIAHGAKDKAVPAERSRAMDAALRAAGATPVYREYADLGHDVWNRAFSEPGLASWLLVHRRG